MPELPEVETVRRGLEAVTLDQSIIEGEVLLDRTVAYPAVPTEFVNGVVGTAISGWHRRGKYLLAQLQRQEQAAGWLGVHLRMTGQLLWLDPAEPVQKHCRVRLFFDARRELRFVDQRTFGRMWWVPPGQPPESIITGLQKLGAEPLSDEFSLDYFSRVLKNRRRPIKNALLEQSLIAGIGNIYADEALFMSHIHPLTLASELQSAQLEKLHAAIIEVLETSIGEGGTTFSDFRDIQGVNGNYGGLAWVYGRDRTPCRVCGTTIERIKLAGRSAHFCPQCQRQN
ncbi:MAG: DNA-formamidopyrimidine glycosylase [Thainema sp.]